MPQIWHTSDDTEQLFTVEPAFTAFRNQPQLRSVKPFGKCVPSPALRGAIRTAGGGWGYDQWGYGKTADHQRMPLVMTVWGMARPSPRAGKMLSHNRSSKLTPT